MKFNGVNSRGREMNATPNAGLGGCRLPTGGGKDGVPPNTALDPLNRAASVPRAVRLWPIMGRERRPAPGMQLIAQQHGKTGMTAPLAAKRAEPVPSGHSPGENSP